jgi:hypothetical protein
MQAEIRSFSKTKEKGGGIETRKQIMKAMPEIEVTLRL